MRSVPTCKILLNLVRSLIRIIMSQIYRHASSSHDIPPRNSADLANDHRGQRLIDICIMCNAHIVNGRKTGDTLGKMTCFR